MAAVQAGDNMADTISSELPAWLQRRVSFTDNGVSRDMQAGFQMAQQAIQNNRQLRALQLQEEARRLALDEKERVAQGAVEVTRVLAEMGQSGDYTSPALQSKFWDAVSKNPKFVSSPAFKDIMDNFQYAEQAKARKELLNTTYNLRDDNAYNRHLDRLAEQERRGEISKDVLATKSDYDLLMEDARQEHRHDNIRFQTDENMRRDAAKPRTLRPSRYDLDESDRMSMAAELDSLKTWYRNQSFSQSKAPMIEAEYDRRLKEIEEKFTARRKTAEPAAAPATPTSDPLGLFK